MTVRASWAALLLACVAHPAAAAVFSGEVRIRDAQKIFTPPSMSSPVVLRYYVPEGSRVKPGDVLLRIDAGQAAVQLRTLDEQIVQARPKIAKEAADLELKAIDAELASIDADAALETAKVDAALPRKLVSALDYDRYQAEFERAARDAALKLRQWTDARDAVARRRADGELELQKLTEQRAFNALEVDAAEVKAERAGTVTHGFATIFFGGNNTGRFEEGSSSYPGNEVGEVVGDGAKGVRAFVLESDRAEVRVGGRTRLAFDALPGSVVPGTITSISGAPGAKPEWGAGRYFVVEIALDADGGALPLKPGMSVRVETADEGEKGPASSLTADGPSRSIETSGEVYARVTAAISPPAIDDLWQMNVTEMAGDGAPVHKGQRIVAFDGGEVPKTIGKKQGDLQEKLRTQEKLRLELADKARTEALATAQGHADTIKAQRKANQPEAFLAGVEYKKLVIARGKAEQKEQVTRRREQVAASERGAEQGLADADVARLKDDVARLTDSLAKLVVTAPRDGIFLHASSWRGEKIDVGSQVWRGMSVGEIPDTTSLAVRAAFAERDAAHIALGAPVRVTLEGGSGQTLTGRVDDIGGSVHSKSRVEPVPVVDVLIALDPSATKLKPGQPVRIELANVR